MAIQIRADQISEIIRSQTRGFERTGVPLWDLSNRCLYGTDANYLRDKRSKMNII